jgi:hypothetical protein
MLKPNKYFTQNIYNKQKPLYYYNKNFIELLNKKWHDSNSKLIRKSLKTTLVKKNINYQKENLNKKIEVAFFNYKFNKEKLNSSYNNNDFSPVWLKNTTFFNLSEVNLTLKKELILLNYQKKRQIFYFIKEFVYSLHAFNKTLIKENVPNKERLTSIKFMQIQSDNKVNIFYNNYMSNVINNVFNPTIFNKNHEISLALSNKLIQNINFYLYASGLNAQLVNIINDSLVKNLFIFYNVITDSWFETQYNQDIKYKCNSINKLNLSKNLTLNHYQKIRSIFFSQQRINKNFINYFFNKKIRINKTITHILWKKNNSLFQKSNFSLKKLGTKHFYVLPSNRIQTTSNTSSILIKKNKNRFINLSQILYVLTRLEEKIDLLNKNANTKPLATEITKVYNLLTAKILQKNNNNITSSLILSNINEIFKTRKYEWKNLFLRAINQWLKINIKNKNGNVENLNSFFSKIQKKFELLKKHSRFKKLNLKSKDKFIKSAVPFIHNINKGKNFFTFQSKKKTLTSQLNIRKSLTNEKLILQNNYIKFNQNKEALSVLTNKKVKIFFINALSLTKYAFNLERKIEKKEKRSPTLFLQNIDRDMINKYKYVGIYIKDLIRVCFIGMFLKKATFMAKFIAFQIAKLPRNRRETSFIRFIVKVVKTFAAEREEILGLRIKFKGRVNRWRRTKSIVGERGVVPLHTIDNRIECGSAQAINRKGALGIRIWIRYKPSFSTLIKNSILKFFAYSKKLKEKKKAPRYIYFTRKN